MRWLLVITLFFLPSLAFAEVVFNEIAWMGSEESANDEWIELFNSTEAKDLTGWKIEADDGSPSIELSGRIGQGDYFLLERTDDTSAPGAVADLIFSGSLANTGEMLRLYDANGSVVDTVNGSDEWSIGGDNATKNTLQRSSSGWITASPTPGRVNSTQAQLVQETDTTTSNTSRSSSSKNGTSILHGSEDEDSIELIDVQPEFLFSLGEDRVVSVGSRVPFEAVLIRDDGKRIRAHTTIAWNLGDGSVAQGERITHYYKHPGTYVVYAEAHINRFGEQTMLHDRVLVEVRAATVAVTESTNEFVELTNQESHEVDISGWHLSFPQGVVTLPRGTIVLANQSLRIPLQQTTVQTPRLVTAAGMPVSVRTESIASQRTTVRTNTPPLAVATPKPQVLLDLSPEEVDEDTSSRLVASVAEASTGAGTPAGPIAVKWLWALAGVLGVAIVAVLLGKKEHSSTSMQEVAPEVKSSEENIVDDSETLPGADEFTILDVSDKRD